MNYHFKKLGIAFLIVGAIYLSSCIQRNAEDYYPSSHVGANCDTANITFSGTIQPIINTQCATSGCHAGSSPTGYDFSNYAGIKAVVTSSKLMNSIVWNGAASKMPKDNPKLDDCTIAKFQIWVNDGAPNN